MDPQMSRRLANLQRQAVQLGDLAASLTAAAPRRVEGSDKTGWVRVTLGGDGLPETILVRSGWRQRLEAGRLGAAVLEANGDALACGTRPWSDALDGSRWWIRSGTR